MKLENCSSLHSFQITVYDIFFSTLLTQYLNNEIIALYYFISHMLANILNAYPN